MSKLKICSGFQKKYRPVDKMCIEQGTNTFFSSRSYFIKTHGKNSYGQCIVTCMYFLVCHSSDSPRFGN